MSVNTAAELFSSCLDYSYAGEKSVAEAKGRFLELQADGVIRPNCSFESDVWFTTDQYANIGLHFKFNVFSYTSYYKNIFNLPFDEFINCVKTYLISVFGRNALTTMNSLLLDLRHIINTKASDVIRAYKTIKISSPMLCFDFFSSLPKVNDCEEIDQLLAALDSFADKNILNSREQRSLADFDSYFLFDEIIKSYWASPLDVDTRLFYYPLYLWWSITAVLPLRPREFILTERDCLTQDENGNYFLRVRRNKLKGGRKNISYKISDDYETNTYMIPPKLGDEIKKYIELTSQYDDTDIQTLFVMDTHYKKWERGKAWNNRYLTYVNMTTILRYFFKEVIVGQHNLTVRYDHPKEHLPENEICFIHLGDTRHIALINMVQEGATPVITMMLAGHENMTMASHYYSNVSKLLECKTYRQCRKLLHGDNTYHVTPAIGNYRREEISKPKKELSDGAFCISAEYQKGSIADCLKAVGPNAEIGHCPSCTFYRPEEESFFSYEDIYRQNLKTDCEALEQAVNIVRAGKGDKEDIGEALLKVRASSSAYEEFLYHKNMQIKEG